MHFTDILKLSLRMFRARTMRTLLTILGMSIGIAAILFLVSLGYGLQQTLLQRITSSDALATLDITEDQSKGAIINQESIERLRNLPGVTATIPAVRVRGQGKFDTVTLDLDTLGSSATFLRLENIKVLSGRLLSTETKTVVITSGIAKTFGKSPDDMIDREFSLTLFLPIEGKDGQTSTKGPETFRVVGVVESEENVAYFALDDFPGADTGRFQSLKVKAATAEQTTPIRDEILKLDFAVSSISDTINQANKVFGAIQIILMAFGLVALFVSAIGMFNTMTIALLERTEEIGIMKSIGASRTSISLMFIVEATLMGFLGSVVGVVLGWFGGKACNYLLNFIATRFGGESVSLFSTPTWFILVIVAFGSVVGLFTGLFPARQASRIDPLDALRYK
jgi:putative ABC transport system permease protein